MSELALKLIAENKAKHARGEDARVLDLGNCGLTEVPEEVGELVWLEELILNNENNRLSSLFGVLNRGLTKRNRRIPNRIETIPDIIGNLSNLKKLDLTGNPIRVISTRICELEKLIDCDNQSKLLKIKWNSAARAEQYTQASLLRNKIEAVGGLMMDPNYLVVPPIEIAIHGLSAIKRYFHEKDIHGSAKLNEAKCLILGEGGSGKTSLARKLLHPDNPLPAEKETTQGIDVHPHDLKLPDGSDFRLNIWDFGGQEIYHATHQFFLTKRSLYILLDDTRKDEKTVNDPTFNYWLQVAGLYGGGSPLLIVQNEKGDRSKQLDLKGMQGRFGFVKDARAANLLTCRGLEEVWAAIQYWLKQLPHIGEEQPKAWLDIRRELERLAREEGKDFISLEKYYEVCAQRSIPERERALFLSGYLHDFGAFLHFQDHPLLRKMLVLNNQWATDAVYKVLDFEPVKKAFGRFTRADLTKIWSDARYADQHDELLALMEKFELCYKLPDEKMETWLAPQLLSVLQPDALVWDERDNLQIRYEYEFMPKGLLSQHIVRMHRYVRQPDLAWKSGVVFERAGSQALVTEAWGSRNIRLRARGPQAKELLTLLAEDFDKMHERLEGLRVKKMIPCNCRACAGTAEPHFYEHDDLARRKSLGKRTIECKISFDDVTVTDLLDGVFAKNMSNPRELLESGQIEEALRLLLPNKEASLLLGQFINAEKEFNHQRIEYKEFKEVESKVLAAAMKLV